MYRHGDVFVAPVRTIPARARRLPAPILAEGEITGHCHRIAEPATAEVFEAEGQCFLRVRAERAALVHEEHKPIVLPRGNYRVWIQREYTPQEIRRVID